MRLEVFVQGTRVDVVEEETLEKAAIATAKKCGPRGKFELFDPATGVIVLYQRTNDGVRTIGRRRGRKLTVAEEKKFFEEQFSAGFRRAYEIGSRDGVRVVMASLPDPGPEADGALAAVAHLEGRKTNLVEIAEKLGLTPAPPA